MPSPDLAFGSPILGPTTSNSSAFSSHTTRITQLPGVRDHEEAHLLESRSMARVGAPARTGPPSMGQMPLASRLVREPNSGQTITGRRKRDGVAFFAGMAVAAALVGVVALARFLAGRHAGGPCRAKRRLQDVMPPWHTAGDLVTTVRPVIIQGSDQPSEEPIEAPGSQLDTPGGIMPLIGFEGGEANESNSSLDSGCCAFVQIAYDTPDAFPRNLWLRLAMARALQRMSRYPLVLLTNTSAIADGFSTSSLLARLNVQVLPILELQPPEPARGMLDEQSERAFWKIQIWKLTQFRRLIWLEHDSIVFRPLDWLFDLPPVKGQRGTGSCEVSLAEQGSWLVDGLLLIEPSEEIFDSLMSFAGNGDQWVHHSYAIPALIVKYFQAAASTMKYVGCYVNEDPNRAAGQLLQGLTPTDCAAAAASQGHPHFGMQFPQGYEQPDQADCILLDGLPGTAVVPDAECESETAGDGSRLGGGGRLATYERPQVGQVELISPLAATTGECLGHISTWGYNRTLLPWPMPAYVHRSSMRNECFDYNLEGQWAPEQGGHSINLCTLHPMGPFWRDMFCEALQIIAVYTVEMATFCNDTVWYATDRVTAVAPR